MMAVLLVSSIWGSGGFGRPLHHATHGPPPPPRGGGSRRGRCLSGQLGELDASGEGGGVLLFLVEEGVPAGVVAVAGGDGGERGLVEVLSGAAGAFFELHGDGGRDGLAGIVVPGKAEDDALIGLDLEVLTARPALGEHRGGHADAPGAAGAEVA